jgi:hypothetical protein
MRLVPLFALLAAPAFAGDSAEGPPIFEDLIATVIEVEDLGPLLLRNTPDYWAARGVSEDMLWDFFDDGGDGITTPPTIAAVPVPAPLFLLLGALGALGVIKRRKTWK